jgi:hypothetical protein
MGHSAQAEAVLALRNFGLGPRLGSVAAIAGDPRGARIAEIDRPGAGLLPSNALAPSAQAFRSVADANAARQARRILAMRAAQRPAETAIADPSAADEAHRADARTLGPRQVVGGGAGGLGEVGTHAGDTGGWQLGIGLRREPCGALEADVVHALAERRGKPRIAVAVEIEQAVPRRFARRQQTLGSPRHDRRPHGWDTHVNEGAAVGQLAGLLGALDGDAQMVCKKALQHRALIGRRPEIATLVERGGLRPGPVDTRALASDVFPDSGDVAPLAGRVG